MSTVILGLQNIYKKFGKRVSARDLNLDIREGEFFTILGPSGSGKSTVLRMIAGLEIPDSGEVLVHGRNVTKMPPWHRQIGMVFQHYANFPHLNVEQNIAYGLRRLRLTKQAQKDRVSELLALVGMQGFESRHVAQLSGGEQQRIAIARALAPRPDILLLDEPLSALDEKIRREMQHELREIQQSTGTTFIYVTHDQEEALTMSDRIAVLNNGVCIQCDEPGVIFRRPRTPFVAQFFRGSNVLKVSVGQSDVDHTRVSFGGGTWAVPTLSRKSFNAAQVAIRSEAVMVDDDVVKADVQLEAHVKAISYRGIYTSCELELNDKQNIAVATLRKLPVRVGETIKIGINASDIVLLERE